MAKGIKMEVCRKEGHGPRLFRIGELSAKGNGRLVCQYCSASVCYVSGYSKESSNTWVPAYLRLWRGGEHENDCPNTLTNAVIQIVSESRAIENAEPLFHQQDDGTYIIRFNRLKEAESVAKKLAESGESIDSDQSNAYQGNQYVTKEPLIYSVF